MKSQNNTNHIIKLPITSYRSNLIENQRYDQILQKVRASEIISMGARRNFFQGSGDLWVGGKIYEGGPIFYLMQVQMSVNVALRGGGEEGGGGE